MIVVSDATPLNIMIRIGEAIVLPSLYSRVVIPPAVRDELTHANTPEIVRAWMENPPAWLEVRVPHSPGPETPKGRGEREAIALAIELHAELLLVDDRAAARTARAFGIDTVGTVGILELASVRGISSLPESLAKLRATNFFIADEVLDAALARHRGRQKDQRRL